jgi:uncharacterized protein YacL
MMNISITFVRVLFVLLSVLIATIYAVTISSEGFTPAHFIIGIVSGSAFGVAIISIDLLYNKFSLRSWNTAIVGLFCGYLLGQAILLILTTAFDALSLQLSIPAFSLIKIAVLLCTTYLGLITTAHAAEEVYVSIPFVKFKPTNFKKKDLLIDPSAFMDTRVIDLAISGLLDHQLVIPRFLIKEFNENLEAPDESTKFKARRSLDTMKKLENIPTLELRYTDTDFPELKDTMSKLIRLARVMDANIITADMNRIQQASVEGVRMVNLHHLANALKPLTQTGEYINIKIQRYGKDPRQGVGYLDDGTMVVVNGGAEFIGETIKAQVLSVKHTTSGRMIFCNTADESLMTLPDIEQAVSDLENTHKNYFAL